MVINEVFFEEKKIFFEKIMFLSFGFEFVNVTVFGNLKILEYYCYRLS